MLVKDNLSNLFALMETKKGLLIFDYIDSDTLDTMFINKYGERTLRKIGTLNVDVVSSLLVDMFNYKWDKSIENYLISTINIMEGGQRVLKNTNIDTVNSINRSVLNKVSAYNDSDLSENDEDVETLEGTNLEKNDVETQVIKNLSIDNILKIMNYLNSYYIYDIMMIDIIDTVALKIYE